MGDIISPVDAEWDANKDDDEPNDPAGYSLLDLDTGRVGSKSRGSIAMSIISVWKN
jgi:hypothetical protein